jgi:hypothetical protein
MAGQWDGRMKRLVKDNPQDFVSWLKQGAQFHSELNAHLPSRSIDADTLFKVTLNSYPFLPLYQKRSGITYNLRYTRMRCIMRHSNL